MSAIFTNLVVMLMAATYFLLAMQAEIVTKTLGFVFGGILTLALIRATFLQATSNNEKDDDA